MGQYLKIAFLGSLVEKFFEAFLYRASKTITSKIIFEEFPQVKKKLWGGHLRTAGYYAASVGDKVTAEMVEKYIRHQLQTSFD